MNSFKEELQDLSGFVRRFAFWRTLLMIQIGCFMFGLVVSGILIPQNFFAGGLMGISLLILTLSGDWISLSLSTFCSTSLFSFWVTAVSP